MRKSHLINDNQMKNIQKRSYAAPETVSVELEPNSVLCASEFTTLMWVDDVEIVNTIDDFAL